MRMIANIKILIVLAMFGYGLSQIIVTQDGDFVEVEATLLEAYAETRLVRKQSTEQRVTDHHFKYQYTLDGKTYTSGRYAHVYPRPNRAVERFKSEKKGATFTVYVHPSLPSYAVVQKGAVPFFIYALTLSGVLGIFHCFTEWKLNQVDESKSNMSQQQEARVKKYYAKSGAGMGIAILVMFIMLLFDL